MTIFELYNMGSESYLFMYFWRDLLSLTYFFNKVLVLELLPSRAGLDKEEVSLPLVCIPLNMLETH